MSFRNFQINWTKSDTEKRTIIVLGAPRGGTSMIAGLLRIMGVFMGNRIGKNNHEDIGFVRLKKKTDIPKLIELIHDRNQNHSIWGVKYPGMIKRLAEIKDHFINPYYIIVYRNPITSAISKVEKKDTTIQTALSLTQNIYNKILDFVKVSNDPMLFLSYENCCDYPEQMVESISSFINFDLSDDNKLQAINFVNPAVGYQRLESN